ncbi:MAG TPA: transcription-repair coupling factor [Nevskiaceae bacterium]|nr:transcription-repair coupling factor [Nevskiaceae bacterium]
MTVDSPDPRPAVAAQALAVVRAAEAAPGLVLAVAGNEQQAYRLEEALRFFTAGRLPLLHFPDPEVLPYDPFSPHQELLSARLSALHALPEQTRGILLISADALLQRLPPRAWLQARALELQPGQKLPLAGFRERLIATGYTAVSEVQTQGEFAVRGALIDLFPMGSEQAFRLDLFDDEIDSIRSFDPETQRSTEKVSAIRLLPAREFPTDREGIDTFRRRYRAYFPGDPSRSRIYTQVSKNLMPGGIESYLPLFFAEDSTATLFDYLPASTRVARLCSLETALAEDLQQIHERYERYRGDLERPLMQPEHLYLPLGESLSRLGALAEVDLAALTQGWQTLAVGGGETLRLRLQTGQPASRMLFVAESPGRREALLAWLKPLGVIPREHRDWPDFLSGNNRYGIVLGPLQQGVELGSEGLTLVAEAQIFGARAPVESRKRAKVRDPETLLRDLSSLSLGSPVVHVQHGVGRYRGLERLEAGGVEAEYLVLEYAEGAKIYVPVGSLGLIHRYTGAEEDNAPLHALGSERWSKAQARAREKANDVAAELLQIQARRAAKMGLKLELDTADYARFCEGFPFETTPDQQKAIDAVLADLAADKPMDRVVCGDVGFGKTEVALRACFAVARAGRQVCLLAPTTLLAQQHEKNFRDRFAQYMNEAGQDAWPIKVAALSRLRTSKEQAAMLQELAEGRLDIVIGTHRLLQGDVKFKNLGLVVVDEEHRFGVRHKEKLKNLRAEVDLLTLTATPIPRTLNMSLAGLRDLSIIATPPASRLAIRTFVAEWDQNLVVEACQRELKRGGQVYYLYNEVSDIALVAEKLQKLLPEARVQFAHGQMRERELEQVMLDFYHQRFDILVSTTIIESGIDVPSANTILIDRADRLGLAQLHQLRGRVGRSHHRAYAYLLVPSKRALSADAQKRLDAIETLGELGSGFALATHDLEIRGAGELLGEDQSGQIEEVGFTMYAELLARAVKALKSGKLADAPFGASDCEVDLGVSSLIPDDYVPDVHQRLVLYKRAAECGTVEALDELKVEMIDRFGLLPPPAERLLEAARLRIRAQALGLSRLRVSARGAVLEFGPEPRIEPVKLIKLIQTQPKVYRLEGQKKLHIQAPLPEPATRGDQIERLLTTLAA